MKNLFLSIPMLALLLMSCETEETITTITQGDYPVKEYYLERDPKVNVWGAGIDFVHSECQLADTELDYIYMTDSDDFAYDVNFYTVKTFYYTSSGDMKVMGTPALLLSTETQACKLGEGLDFFDSLTVITPEMMLLLTDEPEVDYAACLDTEVRYYIYDSLYVALSECVIGDDFRGTELVIPEGKTEEKVQAVYLIKTAEDAYVKFMVVFFKPEKPNDKQTLVRWQVISE